MDYELLPFLLCCCTLSLKSDYSEINSKISDKLPTGASSILHYSQIRLIKTREIPTDSLLPKIHPRYHSITGEIPPMQEKRGVEKLQNCLGGIRTDNSALLNPLLSRGESGRKNPPPSVSIDISVTLHYF